MCDIPFIKKYTKQNFDQNGNTLMHKAIKDEDLILLYKVAMMENNVNKQNKDGFTALHYAVKHGNLEVIEVALQCGIDSKLKSKLGQTAMDIAEQNGRDDILKLLGHYSPGLQDAFLNSCPGDVGFIIDRLKKWVNLRNVIRSLKNTELLSEAKEKQLVELEHYEHTNEFLHLVGADDVTQLEIFLTKKKIGNINSVHPLSGFTALALAIRNENNKMIRLLLENGADPTIRLKTGVPLTHYAADQRAPFVVLLSLLKDSATWHMRSPVHEGHTILFVLAKQDYITETHIEKLLEHTKCQILIDCDQQGRNFVDFCYACGRETLVKATHKSILEVLLLGTQKKPKTELLKLALRLVGNSKSILDIPDNMFIDEQERQSDDQILKTMDHYRTFQKNITMLENAADKLAIAIKDNDLVNTKKNNIADFVFQNGRTALHEAILLDKFEITWCLMSERPELCYISDRENKYPLHYAYGVAHAYGTKYVRMLLENSGYYDLDILTDMNNIIPSYSKDLEIETTE